MEKRTIINEDELFLDNDEMNGQRRMEEEEHVQSRRDQMKLMNFELIASFGNVDSAHKDELSVGEWKKKTRLITGN